MPVRAGQTGASGAGSQLPKETLAIHDQVVVTASDVEGISGRPLPIGLDGTITLPLVGKVRASGLTVEQLRNELTAQFAVYIRSPRVTVKRLASRVETIVAAGCFKDPGVHALPERRALLDVLAATGGFQANTARSIKVTRRLGEGRPPLPSGIEDREAGVSTLTVNLPRLIENPGLSQELIVEPDDVLFAEAGGTVFVMGEVLRPGSFELGDKDSLGLTEVIARAGGLGRDAGADRTRLLRPILNGSRRAEIPIDMTRILEGRAADFRVLADDVVLVPRSKGKSRTLKTAVKYLAPIAASALIYLAVRD